MRARLVRLRSELNNTRLTLLVTLLFTMLVATIFPTPAIRFTVALFCAGPFVSFVIARFFARSISVSRSVATTVSVGDRVHGRIEVRNRAPYPVFFAQINIGQCLAPGGRRTPQPALAPVDGIERIFATLGAGERASLAVEWHAVRRGVWQLSPVLAGATDPLGLATVQTARTDAHTVTVLPRPLPLMKLGFLSGSRDGTRPLSHAASVNEALDFHGIRLWQPGESMRRVHWKSTARTGELHVIEWEEDLSADLAVLLDVQTGAGEPEGGMNQALETGITVAASVAAYLLANGNSFQLYHWRAAQDAGAARDVAPALKLGHHRARGQGGLEATLHALAHVQPLPHREASLNKLAAQANLSGDLNLLLITLGYADAAGAISQLQAMGVPARQCTILSVEPDGAASVPLPGTAGPSLFSAVGRKVSGPKGTAYGTGAAPGAAPDGRDASRPVPSVRTRRLHSGESLTALLERD